MIIMSKFPPSSYQQAVLDFIGAGNGNAFVSAVAGSGKTTTLEMICQGLAGKGTAAFVAFNRHIRDELAARLPQSVTVATIHQIGLRTAAYGLGKRITVDNQAKLDKEMIETFVINKFPPFLSLEDQKEKKKEMDAMGQGLAKLIRFAKSSLVDGHSINEVEDIIERFDIDVEIEDAMKFLAPALARTIEYARKTGIITFDDMIWLPCVMNMKPQQFDWIMVDEAQDLTAAQRCLCMAMVKPRGRAIFVGDPRQAIYAFAGADAQSVKAIMTETKAKILPLSVSYRCPKSHVAMAKEIVPEILHADNAAEGIIRDIPEENLAMEAQVNDLVLCRTTAPLIKQAFAMIALRKPAKVKGRDLGAGLIAIADKIRKNQKVKDKDFEAGFINACSVYEENQKAKLAQREGNEIKIQRLQDQISSLIAVVTAVNANSFKDLEDGINGIFADNCTGIILCTVHRAKGLEANRVFILKPELMPHPMAKSEEQKEQEQNIRYIALTRSKNEMVFTISPPEEKKKKS